MGCCMGSDLALSTRHAPSLPHKVPKIGVFSFGKDPLVGTSAALEASAALEDLDNKGAVVGILFYRAHYLAGNTRVIDAIATVPDPARTSPAPYLCFFFKRS